MDCKQAQEQILESNTPNVENHLAGCETCRRFLEIQTMLDVQLRASITAPPLSGEFRKSLNARIRRESVSTWPTFLPDIAHVAGCVAAIALCLWLLPFAAGPVILSGLAFTVATWFAQSLVQGSLETWDENHPA